MYSAASKVMLWYSPGPSLLRQHGEGAFSMPSQTTRTAQKRPAIISAGGVRRSLAQPYRRGMVPAVTVLRAAILIRSTSCLAVSGDLTTVDRTEEQTMTINLANHPVVSRQQWLAERRKLLVREKELTRLSDKVARERQALPWVRLEKNYQF